MIRLVVGLGNPGRRYENTRHNSGYLLVDRFARRLEADDWQEFGAHGVACRVGLEAAGQVTLAKPTTYMNESGIFVAEIARFYKIEPADIMICVDDFALPLGRIRLRERGSAGGQNGLKSIFQRLGTQDVPRLRVGIGPTPEGWDPADFVLSKFKPSETAALDKALALGDEALEAAIRDGVVPAMNRYNAAEAA